MIIIANISKAKLLIIVVTRMANIYLIRHCESEGNACRRAQAQTDALVTRKGYEQNEALRSRFKGIPIDAIYTSDTFRSIMTAAPIAGERNLPIRVRFLLRELTTGVWEDCAWGNIAHEYPAEHDVWTQTPWITTAPGATTFQQVSDRMIHSIRRIAREAGDGTALVVSHSCSIKASLCSMLNMPMERVGEVGHGDNTSVSLLHVDADGNIEVEYRNDDSHLPSRLRRAWNGVAGSDINMTIYPCDPRSEMDVLLKMAGGYSRERGAVFDAEACRESVQRQMEKDPNCIGIGRLKGKAVGFVRYGGDEALPKEYGVVQQVYIIPELQGIGYSEQLFGYAMHAFRYQGKTRAAMLKAASAEEARMFSRFTFHEMNGFPDYMELNLITPPCPYPVLP